MIDSLYLVNFLKEYKGVSTIEVEKEYIKLAGTLRLNHNYNLLPYSEKFKVEIIIPKNYPTTLPLIKESGGILDRNYEHINYDGTLCLEVERVIRNQLFPKYDLIEWVEEFVYPFLYSYCYFRDYGIYPFGDRSHGAKGILEYYSELFDIEDIKEVRILLTNFIKVRKKGKNYKGHNLCPCGSSLKIRNCHGIEALKKLLLYVDNQMIKDLKLIELEESYYED